VAVSLVLWDQERETEILQKRLGIAQPLVEVFSNDPRLKDLAAWDPATEMPPAPAEEATGTDGVAAPLVQPKPSASLRPRPGPARRRRRML
jgi:hypothetical protein